MFLGLALTECGGYVQCKVCNVRCLGILGLRGWDALVYIYTRRGVIVLELEGCTKKRRIQAQGKIRCGRMTVLRTISLGGLIYTVVVAIKFSPDCHVLVMAITESRETRYHSRLMTGLLSPPLPKKNLARHGQPCLRPQFTNSYGSVDQLLRHQTSPLLIVL